ncbi:MAG: PQQ-binding-like beta-propeller repeat protein [Verrucomicrobiota bacterium]
MAPAQFVVHTRFDYIRRIVGVVCLAFAMVAGGQEPGARLWSFDAGSLIQSSPAVGADGTICFGSDDGTVFALNPDGSKKWEFKTGGAIASSPAIGPDGTIYVGSTDRVLYALNADGTLRWLISPGTSIVASPALGADGTIYIATVFKSLFAISPGGNKKWEYAMIGNLIGSPVVGKDGTIYQPCREKMLYAITPEGARRWVFETADGINASPALAADGTIYVGTLDGLLYALTPDGAVKWKYPTGAAIRSSPAIAPDGTVYVGSDDNFLHAVNPDGLPKWKSSTGNWVRSSPAIDVEGTVYVGSYDHSLHAFGKDGLPKWQFATGWHISSSPAIATNAVVYIGSWDKQFYAIKAGAPLAHSAWPMFRRDLRRSARLGSEASAVTVTLQGPEQGRRLMAPASVGLQASVDGETEPVATVEFYEGATRLGETTTRPYVFVWTGVAPGAYVVTARATLKSGATYESNPLTVIIDPPNKMDRVQPTVAIVAPDPTIIWRDTSVVVRGTAKDDIGIARVEFQVGTGPVQTAVGTTNWFAVVEPKPGINKFWVKAVDTSGNASLVISQSYLFRTRLLTVRTNGVGKITPNLDNEEPELNKAYTLTGEAGKDHTFAGWSGTFQSSNPRITFTLETNAVIQANFVPNPFAQAQGTFAGLIQPTDKSLVDWAGHFTVSLNASGQLRGRLQLGRENYSINSPVDASGYLQTQLVARGGTPLNLELKLDLLHDHNAISGKVSGDNLTADLLGDRGAGESGPSAQAGKYTLLLPAPENTGTTLGDGFATITVSSKGAVSLRGALGDGTEIRHETSVAPNGVCPVSIPLYEGRGVLQGWVRFAGQSHSDLHGKLTWVKLASPEDKSFPAGFAHELSVLGSAYKAPAANESILTVTSNLLAGFQGADLKRPLTARVSISPDHRIAIETVNQQKLTFRLSFDSGLFQGSFVHPETRKDIPFQGVLLQKQNWGGGHFRANDGAGSVYIGPAGGG